MNNILFLVISSVFVSVVALVGDFLVMCGPGSSWGRPGSSWA